jgi:hypothetical protein
MATEEDDDGPGLIQAVAHHGLASAAPIGRARISGFRGIVYRWLYRRSGGDGLTTRRWPQLWAVRGWLRRGGEEGKEEE